MSHDITYVPCVGNIFLVKMHTRVKCKNTTFNTYLLTAKAAVGLSSGQFSAV